MALDHYVSQVHLRRFYAPSLDRKKMYAFRKGDGNEFICGSEDVCRLPDGSTNSYFSEPRLIEEFLKLVEPRYNAACSVLGRGETTADAVFAIAGFAAFVASCSPTAIRLGISPLEAGLRLDTEILDRLGELPRAPPELGGKTVSELLADGELGFEIDGKYPQALGIGNILKVATQYGNAHWDILSNEHEGTPFFTSDFPVAVEPSADWRVVNRIVPLTPYLAIRISPRIQLAGRALEPHFEHFSYRRYVPDRREVIACNRAIVRCAEDLVFYPLTSNWIPRFVAKNAGFRVETETTHLRHGSGYLTMSQIVVREGPLGTRPAQ